MLHQRCSDDDGDGNIRGKATEQAERDWKRGVELLFAFAPVVLIATRSLGGLNAFALLAAAVDGVTDQINVDTLGR